MGLRKKELLRLMAGFRRFRERNFHQENSPYARLSTAGQSPKTLIIGCSDSRVDPALITDASPGEIFVVRNVANLVPPFKRAEEGGFHGVSSAIEFAVVNLKVENIVVLGHRQCGGIHALMTEDQSQPGSFVSKWMQIAKPAKAKVLREHPDASADEKVRCCELESIVTSLQNLLTFPFVADAVRDRGLNLIGAYFDLERGQLLQYDEESSSFKPIEV